MCRTNIFFLISPKSQTMKHTLKHILMLGCIVIVFSSCARFYGFKQPLAQPQNRETVANSITTEPQVSEAEPLSTPEDDQPIFIDADKTPAYSLAEVTIESIDPAILDQKNVIQVVAPLFVPGTTSAWSASSENAVSKPDNSGRMDGLAIAGFVLSLVGLFLFGYICGALGIIFSAIALVRIKRSGGERRGKGLAIAGLIIGIADIILLTILLAYV
jgi:hypothetical protein